MYLKPALILLSAIVFLSKQAQQQECTVDEDAPSPSALVQVRCGIRQFNDSTPHIRRPYGEDKVNPGDWPWHVAIFHRQKLSEIYACGGSLISGLFVLTAAYCVTNPRDGSQLPARFITVRLGVHDLHEIDRKRFMPHSVARIVLVSGAGAALQQNLKNDIALLELSTVAMFTEFVQPICVDQERHIAGMVGTTVGWGYLREKTLLALMEKVELPIVEDIECLESDRDYFGATLDGGTFCAGQINSSSVCSGDIGSGLFVNRGDAWYLVGIVSHTENEPQHGQCVSQSYTVFTRIYKYFEWIQTVTQLRDTSMENEQTKDYRRYFPLNCGVHTVNRIAQGRLANVFEFPWMAIVMTDGLPVEGVLISRRYVLTNALLVSYFNATSVILGDHTLEQDIDCDVNDPTDCAPPAKEYGVECVKTHPKFSEFDFHYFALIRLDRDVVFEDHIHPVCLPATPELRQHLPDQFIATAWHDFEEQKTLRKGMMRRVNFSECEKQDFDESPFLTVTDQQFCAEEADNETVSEWPILGYVAPYGKQLRFVLVGILTWLWDPAGASPVVYTKLAGHMDWIVANMRP